MPGAGSPRPLNVLVIGVGPAASQMHLPVLARLRDRGDIALALVCDLQPERAAAARRTFGFQGESGDAAAALGRADVDAVYLFGSAQLHYEYGLAALRAGRHLFVEKPIAPSYSQALEMARVAAERGLIAVGGHNRRFYGSLLAVRAHAGKAGWRFAQAVFHKPEFGRPPPFGARTWLSANGIHALDALLFMMGGLPEQVTALSGETSAGQPANFSAIMRWADGAQGAFLCNNAAGSRREEYVFHGLGETCTVTDQGLTIEKDNGIQQVSPVSGDGLLAEHEAFVQAIRNETRPPHSIESLAPSLYLAELIEEGFSGRVPHPPPPPAVLPRRPHAGTSVLVVQPAELQSALVRLLPHYRLVSAQEVRASTERRVDITAAILGRGAPALGAELLDKMPALAVVGIVGLSLGRYEPEMLLARDIALLNASAVYAESVAEFAFALATLGRRRAFLSHEIMRRGGWGTHLRTVGMKGRLRRTAQNMRPALRALGWEPFLLRIWRAASASAKSPGVRAYDARDLRGATAGLIGWSANARAFAARLLQAQVRVLVYSEHATEAQLTAAGVAPASLREVLAADIVSLHRGLNSRTWHFLGAAELEQLRPGAVLINVARGALIDPQALIPRLRRGDIVACLDTYEMEPLNARSAPRKLPNVFLTSHIAGGSSDLYAAAAEEVVGKVAAYLDGQAVNPVSADRLRTMT